MTRVLEKISDRLNRMGIFHCIRGGEDECDDLYAVGELHPTAARERKHGVGWAHFLMMHHPKILVNITR